MRKTLYYFLSICCLLMIAACSKNDKLESEITNPDEDKESTLQLSILKGNYQIALPGASLYDTLTVKITDKENKPVSGKVIGFKTSNAGVILRTTEVVSDYEGVVRNRVDLGNISAGDYKDVITVYLVSDEKTNIGFSLKIVEATEIDTWLTMNPRIAEAISWPQSSSSNNSYSDWSATQKTALFYYYQQAKEAWGKEVSSVPPPNRNSGSSTIAKFASSDVWPIYLSNIAVSLHLEMNNLLKWSLLDYGDEELSMLLDGRTFFLPDGAASTLYQLNSANTARRIVPESAFFIRSFLQKENIIKEDRVSTISSLLDWCHQYLAHYSGGFDNENVFDHWQYSAAVPVSRMIEGTTRLSDQQFRNYTPGCHGTVDFIKLLLRSVNIPVVSFRSYDSHRQAFFPSEGLYLSHGDDPYNAMTWVTPAVSMKDLLIDQSTYDKWFNGPVKESVARSTREFAINHLSNILVNLRAQEPVGTLPDNSLVFDRLKTFFTLDELVERDLWTRLDAKIEALGRRDRIPDVLIGRYQ